jgi:hypothetical protein
MSADYKQAVLAVADRVGMDGKGKDGVVGYFRYLALQYPAAYCKLLSRIIDIEEVYPQRLSRTSDQLDADIRQSIRTDCQQSDSLIAEMTIMAIKHPEVSAAIAALLPRPSKRRLYQNPCTR